MKRIRELSDIYPYHVSGRCNNSNWFSIDLCIVWKVFEKHLIRLKTRDKVRIHHFVLMSNHYHLILSTPDANLSRAMCNFQRDVSRELNILSNMKDHLFGKRFFSSVLEKSFHYLMVLKYVYRNPVRANICQNIEEYEFSSVNQRTVPFELSSFDEELYLFNNLQTTLAWLNEPLGSELEEMIKKSLQKKKFKLPATPRSRKQSIIKK